MKFFPGLNDFDRKQRPPLGIESRFLSFPYFCVRKKTKSKQNAHPQEFFLQHEKLFSHGEVRVFSNWASPLRPIFSHTANPHKKPSLASAGRQRGILGRGEGRTPRREDRLPLDTPRHIFQFRTFPTFHPPKKQKSVDMEHYRAYPVQNLFFSGSPSPSPGIPFFGIWFTDRARRRRTI